MRIYLSEKVIFMKVAMLRRISLLRVSKLILAYDFSTVNEKFLLSLP